MSDPAIGAKDWRVGHKVPINVYEGDRPVCQCHTEEDARAIVSAMRARQAACHLVEVLLWTRRDGNTDEHMGHLAEAMNAICELIGEGDAVGYVQSRGVFNLVSGVKL